MGIQKKGNQKKKNNSKAFTFNKPMYKKKPKKPIITTEDKIKENNIEPVVVEASDRYAETIKMIKDKGYFIEASSGYKIFFNDIKEFHSDSKNDTPVLVCLRKSKTKQGGIIENKIVYRIVRYNKDEIIGLKSNNINIWQMRVVNIADSIEVA